MSLGGSNKRRKLRASKQDTTVDVPETWEGVNSQTVVETTSAVGERAELHPLLNEVILTNIFKYVQPDQLPSSRLVCRTWRDVTLFKWRSFALVKLQYSNRDCRVSLNDGTSLGEFLELWYREYHGNCKTKPFQNFHLVGWGFGGTKNLDVTIPRFWQLFGRHISELILVQCKSTKCNGVFKVIRESCPNLETLTLQDFTFSLGSGYRRKRIKEEPQVNLKSLFISTITDSRLTTVMRLTYYELLSHFPNLTYVELESDWQKKEILEFCEAVQMIRLKESGKLPIKLLGTRDPVEIDNDVASTKEMMDRLRQLRIPLEMISFEDDMSLTVLKEIIEFNGDALTKLFYLGTSDPPQCDFPFGRRLEQLQVLEISCAVIKNLNFLNNTPKLEKLRIVDEIIEPHLISGRQTTLLLHTSKFEMAKLKLASLTTLILEIKVSEDYLRFLVKCMPNLRNLKMFLNDTLFPIVCENWYNLVNLEVFGKGLTDKGVNGMKFRRISQETAEVDGKHTIQPNITFLQKLEVFKGPKTKLTNFAFFRGFLNLGNLRDITLCKDSSIGAKVMKALMDRNIKLKRFDCWGQDSRSIGMS